MQRKPMNKYNIMDEEQKKSDEIFILMNVGKMSVTEINTLTDKEKHFLSKWFMEKVSEEEKIWKTDRNKQSIDRCIRQEGFSKNMGDWKTNYR